ncbi:MAG: nucleotidyl transferase AbiEii/AbiGii toxin family protein [Chroococcidiopsidaceae cyanobacterium CP_BM_ER_R8_30]|nr:nucleotidyl transferase AbiEii/AbiGii toxin family protein [Chroococcidiopsidaceae cyanobacterium CP_BM_ER_R8_30]
MECQERDGSPSRNGGLIAILRLKSGTSARFGNFSPQTPLMQVKLTVISILKRTFLVDALEEGKIFLKSFPGPSSSRHVALRCSFATFTPTWSPVACLNENDSITEKLLANTDCWADRRRRSRDLIDLTVHRFAAPISDEAIAKAERVYPAIKNLKQAIVHFQENPDY